jgi:hypothetical protein
VGVNTISVVDAHSFWIDGYFEETSIAPIRVGDPAESKLMGYGPIVHGHVDSIAREIDVANAQPNGQGIATVNPIFTWVRLAQRIPVRIHIDEVPNGIVLVAGITATVQIDEPRGRQQKESIADRDRLQRAAESFPSTTTPTGSLGISRAPDRGIQCLAAGHLCPKRTMMLSKIVADFRLPGESQRDNALSLVRA